MIPLPHLVSATAGVVPREYVPPLDPFGIPAAPWIFEVLTVVTMLLHVVFMNFVLGGAIVATVLDGLTLLRRANHNLTVRIIWQVLPVAMSLTITTGVAPLLFVQVLYGSFFYPANVFMGFTWFAIVPILIVAFYLAYYLSYKLGNVISDRLGRWNQAPGKRLAISLACAALFASVAWILTNNHMLSIQPEQWPQDGEWKQNRLAVTPGATLPRYFHNVGGAIAVTGLWLLCIGWWRKARGVDPAPIAAGIIRTGLWTYLPLAAAAAVLGPVFLFSLPEEVWRAMLRPNPYTVLWWIGLLTVVLQLALAYMVWRHPEQFRWVAGLLAAVSVTLVGMLAARENVRLAFLGREPVGFALADWDVRPQVSSLVLFGVLFVVALAVIAWLIWISARAPAAPRH